MYENAVNIQGRRQLTFTIAAKSFTNPLSPGVYDVWADADVYVKISKDKTDAETVSSSNGYLIRSGNTVPVQITDPSFIAAAGAGTNVYFHQVK
jgi:hypothetical protein